MYSKLNSIFYVRKKKKILSKILKSTESTGLKSRWPSTIKNDSDIRYMTERIVIFLMDLHNMYSYLFVFLFRVVKIINDDYL